MKNIKAPQKKFRTFRLEVIPELDKQLEDLRMSQPESIRLNRSAFIRKILYEYVQAHNK